MNVQTFGQVTLHLEILNVFREMPKSSLRKRFDKIADNLGPPPKKKFWTKGFFGVGTFQLKCSPLHPYAERPQLFISTNAY